MYIRQKNKLAIHQKTTLLIIALLISFSLLCSITVVAQVVSPQTHEPYTTDILNNDYEASVGEPFFLLLSLDPEKLPIGYSVSTLIDVIESPVGAKPEMLTGFPKSRLTMRQAGAYRFSIRVSLMSKSSCGGIDADEIMNKELRLQAAEP